MSIAIFGDVHGHSRLLQELLVRVNTKYQITHWYGCGDLCDRGPDTPGVIQTCIDEGIETVMGNHDEWLLMAMRGQLQTNYAFRSAWLTLSNGGTQTVKQYGGVLSGTYLNVSPKFPASHEEFIHGRPTVIETEHCYILHGGIGTSTVKYIRDKRGQELKLREHENLLSSITPHDVSASDSKSIRWFYKGPDTAEKGFHFHKFDKPQVVGHNGVQKPVISDSHIAIDTGAAWTNGGGLTAVILPEREFVTVMKDEVYETTS